MGEGVDASLAWGQDVYIYIDSFWETFIVDSLGHHQIKEQLLINQMTDQVLQNANDNLFQ